MPVIREKIGRATVGPIGVIRSDTRGAQAIGETISSHAAALGREAFRIASEDAQKAGIDAANAIITEDLLVIDPETGSPEVLSDTDRRFGRIAGTAYAEVTERLFVGSIDREIKAKAQEFARKFPNPETYDKMFSEYIGNMAEPAQDQWRGYIQNAGTAYLAATKRSLQAKARSAALANQKASALLTMKDDLKDMLNLYVHTGTMADQGENGAVANDVDRVGDAMQAVSALVKSGIIKPSVAAAHRDNLISARSSGLLMHSMRGMSYEDRIDLQASLLSGGGIPAPENTDVQAALEPYANDVNSILGLGKSMNPIINAQIANDLRVASEISQDTIAGFGEVWDRPPSPDNLPALLETIAQLDASENAAAGSMGEFAVKPYTDEKTRLTALAMHSIEISLMREGHTKVEIQGILNAFSSNELPANASPATEALFDLYEGPGGAELRTAIQGRLNNISITGGDYQDMLDETAKAQQYPIDKDVVIAASMSGASAAETAALYQDILREYGSNPTTQALGDEIAETLMIRSLAGLSGNDGIPNASLYVKAIVEAVSGGLPAPRLTDDDDSNAKLYGDLQIAAGIFEDNDKFSASLKSWAVLAEKSYDQTNETILNKQALDLTTLGMRVGNWTTTMQLDLDQHIEGKLAPGEDILSVLVFGNPNHRAVQAAASAGRMHTLLRVGFEAVINGSVPFNLGPEQLPRFLNAMNGYLYEDVNGESHPTMLLLDLPEEMQGKFEAMRTFLELPGTTFADFTSATRTRVKTSALGEEYEGLSWGDAILEMSDLPMSRSLSDAFGLMAKEYFGNYPQIADGFEDVDKLIDNINERIEDVYQKKERWIQINGPRTTLNLELTTNGMAQEALDFFPSLPEWEAALGGTTAIFGHNIMLVPKEGSTIGNAQYGALFRKSALDQWAPLFHETDEAVTEIILNTADPRFVGFLIEDRPASFANTGLLKAQVKLLNNNPEYKAWAGELSGAQAFNHLDQMSRLRSGDHSQADFNELRRLSIEFTGSIINGLSGIGLSEESGGE